MTFILLNRIKFVKTICMSTIKAESLLRELNIEYKATHACLERIPETLFEYKPHPKSMTMGYLVLLVAEIPLWIKHMVTDGEIDFATFKHFSPKTNAELVSHFNDNMEGAKQALNSTNDVELEKPFSLKANGQLIYTTSKIKDIGTTLNHWVHHRG